MAYKKERKYLRKMNNTWNFRRKYKDANGRSKYFMRSLQTSSLTVARRRVDIILDEWELIVKGKTDFEFKWEGDINRTTVKQRQLESTVADYLKAKKTDGLKPKSIERIRCSLNNLSKSLGRNFDLTRIKDTHIDDYKEMYGQKKTPAGLNIDIRNIRAFCNWLYDTDRIRHQLKIKQVPEPKRKPQYLTENDIEKIFSLDSISHQMKRFIAFYISTGLRRATPFFGYMDGNWLVIPADAPYNKSKREIEVCLDRTLHRIWEEMIEAKDEWKTRGYMFDNLLGKITKQFKFAIRECGIHDSQHLHNTRHTFAVREWLRTGNIYNVKEQLGHSSVTVTEGYTVHKRSKISDDHPSLKGKVQDQPKKLDLGDSDIVSVTLDEWGLS